MAIVFSVLLVSYTLLVLFSIYALGCDCGRKHGEDEEALAGMELASVFRRDLRHGIKALTRLDRSSQHMPKAKLEVMRTKGHVLYKLSKRKKKPIKESFEGRRHSSGLKIMNRSRMKAVPEKRYTRLKPRLK